MLGLELPPPPQLTKSPTIRSAQIRLTQIVRFIFPSYRCKRRRTSRLRCSDYRAAICGRGGELEAFVRGSGISRLEQFERGRLKCSVRYSALLNRKFCPSDPERLMRRLTRICRPVAGFESAVRGTPKKPADNGSGFAPRPRTRPAKRPESTPEPRLLAKPSPAGTNALAAKGAGPFNVMSASRSCGFGTGRVNAMTATRLSPVGDAPGLASGL
jgi:hypothetical protein